MKLTVKSLKWLRFLHVISVAVWFGATVCLGVLAVICFFQLNESEFFIVAPMVPALYQKTILPAAVFTLLQGIVYGFFTHWGFFKHRWLLGKWILILLLVPCIGVGSIGHMFSAIAKVTTAGFDGGLYDGGRVLLFISLQILIMAIMIGISVFKPWKKSNRSSSFPA